MSSDFSQLSFYAALSANVYNPGAGNKPLGLGRSVASYATLRKDAFYGEIYRVSDDFVVAIRGTDSNADLSSDLDNATGNALTDAQFASTVELVKSALRAAGWNGNPVDPSDPASVRNYDAARAKVTLTGHSLGGGLAAEAAIAFGLQAYIFDPAPFAASGSSIAAASVSDQPVALDLAVGVTEVPNVVAMTRSPTDASMTYSQMRDRYLHEFSIGGGDLDLFPTNLASFFLPADHYTDPNIGRVGSSMQTALGDGAKGLHSIDLLDLVVKTTADAAEAGGRGAIAADILLGDDRAFREAIVNTSNAGLAGPLSTPTGDPSTTSDPSPDIHRAHHRRRWLRRTQDERSRQAHRDVDDRDRQMLGPAPLRGPAETLDRRTHARLDQPQPASDARL